MDFEEVKPHAKDQSNKVVANNSKSLSPESTESSKMRLFLSLQIIHITQCGTKFQTFEECFPKQFLQPASKSIILLGRNQETSKDLRAKLHNQKPHHRMWVFFFSKYQPLFFYLQFWGSFAYKNTVVGCLNVGFCYVLWILGSWPTAGVCFLTKHCWFSLYELSIGWLVHLVSILAWVCACVAAFWIFLFHGIESSWFIFLICWIVLLFGCI